MSFKVFKVRYINSKSSFCYFSERNTKYVAEAVTIKVSYKDCVSYFSTQSLPALSEHEIGINRLQGELLHLQENDDVLVSVVYNMSGLQKLIISPNSEEDYQILELLADNIQSTLLDQIRVVSLHQKFVVWIYNSLHVVVNVDAVKPVNPGRLDNLTEVEIAPPRLKNSLKSLTKHKKSSNFTSKFYKLFNRESADTISNNVLQQYCSTTTEVVFLLHPLDALDSSVIDDNYHFNVYVYKKFFPHNFDTDFYILKLINLPHNNLLEENHNISSLIVCVKLLENQDKESNSFPILYVHNCIFKNFKVNPGAKALLNTIELHKPVINRIELTLQNLDKKDSNSIIDAFKIYLYKNCQKSSLLLNANCFIDFNSWQCILTFHPKTNFALIDSSAAERCMIVMSEFELACLETVKKNDKEYCELVSNWKIILDDAIFSFKTCLLEDGAASENTLIIGKPGTGKSSLAKMLSTKLNAHPLYIHTETISCKPLKGKTFDSLHKVFMNVFVNLVYYQPSVLILDDLHIICGKVIEEDTLTQESMQFNRCAEMLAHMVEKYSNNNRIAILATTNSTDYLNQHIYSSRGFHLFKNVFTIDTLGKDDRAYLLKFLFQQTCISSVLDMENLAIGTEGFVIQDIVDFVCKAIFECLKEQVPEPQVTMVHCDAALKNTVALSLQGIQLHAPGDRDFSDIGGLQDVKNILVESILWPIQFPQIFDKAPLRLQSGLLLYGPPGTGKTILAGAAAKQFGLRLLSVKGPELLSKYIGASEQAVRDIFEKAQNAKPCILFFDEFDSLAPRRGHDNTGVTDRVVNQFLTQLDGIESLTGVFIIAATSRPDLLDPALLRPGRLDKKILCPLPNLDSRLKILQSLSKKISLSMDVNLLEIAEGSEGFSGADLQAVLYTAQLSVIQDVTNTSEGEMTEIIEIHQSHLETALKSTRPSLTKQEIMKYQKIYTSFEGGSTLRDLQAGTQKATLA